MKYAKDEKKPDRLSDNAVSWMIKVMTIKEDELVNKLGLDAAVFLRFLVLCRNLFLFMAVFACLVIIPVNVYFNVKSNYSDDLSKSDAFMLMTPSLISGLPLLAHITLGWLFDGAVLYLLYTNYKHITGLKRQNFMLLDCQKQLFMRTLLVTEIPKRYRTDQGLYELAQSWKTDHSIQQVNVGRNTKDLTILLETHLKVIKLLESVLAKYLKYPDHLPAKRPQMKPFKEDRQKFPRHVDSIDYYVTKLQGLEDQIIDARHSIDSSDYLPYGFISYDTPTNCHIVARYMKNKRHDGVLARLAPRPKDILWHNMVMTRFERGSKQFWGNVLFTFLVIAWIVPNAFMGCFLADLQRIGVLWPAFQTFSNNHSTLFAIVQGFLSPVVTSLIFLILPMILRRMSQWQGKITKTEREKDVTHKLYIFFFFNNLFVFTLIGVGWNMASQLITLKENGQLDSFSQVMSQLRLGRQTASAIINASSFWIMYLLKAHLGAILDLLQAVTLIWNSFQRYMLAPTPRQLRSWVEPQSFNYAAYYNWIFFYATIGLCFTSIQPIITPILAFYLTCDVAFKRYMLMYMFVTKVESDGSFWPIAHDRILFATFIGNLVLLCVVWIQDSWQMATAVIPLLFIIIIYKIWINITLKPQFDYFIPETHEQEMMEFQTAVKNQASGDNASTLEERYSNPALTAVLPSPMVHAKAEHLLPKICKLGLKDHTESDLQDNVYDHQANTSSMPTKFEIIPENDSSDPNYKYKQYDSYRNHNDLILNWKGSHSYMSNSIQDLPKYSVEENDVNRQWQEDSSSINSIMGLSPYINSSGIAADHSDFLEEESYFGNKEESDKSNLLHH